MASTLHRQELRQLDIVLEYLRRVHFFDYYFARQWDNESQLVRAGSDVSGPRVRLNERVMTRSAALCA